MTDSNDEQYAKLYEAISHAATPIDLDALVGAGSLRRITANRYEVLPHGPTLPAHVTKYAAAAELKKKNGVAMRILTFPNAKVLAARVKKSQAMLARMKKPAT